MTRKALSALALWLLSSCTAGTTEFRRAQGAGDAAKRAGRYDEAAARYADAARVGGANARERDEGAFLEAATLVQAGRKREAIAAYDALVARSPGGERTPRAAFDRAFLAIELGEPGAWPALERVLFAYPTAGSARRALSVLVDHENEARAGGGLAWLDAQGASLASTELAEVAAYRRAQELERVGRATEAREAYVRCALRYPYPRGTLTDDAWWNASLLDEAAGRPDVAIDDLRKLLAPREKPAFNIGSYERPRYSAAQLRIAELLRDALHDDAAARREFHTLYTDFPTSRLRDRALWVEGALAKKAGDEGASCNTARALVREFAESRYAGCAPLLCATVAASSKAPACRAYLRDELSRFVSRDGRRVTNEAP
jgi:hypothetical protein